MDVPTSSMDRTTWSLLPHRIISLLYTSLEDWYENLTPLSRIVFISSILASSALTLYGSLHVKRRRGETARAIALLAVMFITLAVLTLFQPLSSSAILHERDDAAVIPNIHDPTAVDPQSVCPGYKALSVAETPLGLTADLILDGDPCNVYGTDIEALSLIVEYQATDRLHIEILPKYIGQANQSWFVLPEALLPKPKAEPVPRPKVISTSHGVMSPPSRSRLRERAPAMFCLRLRALRLSTKTNSSSLSPLYPRTTTYMA